MNRSSVFCNFQIAKCWVPNVKGVECWVAFWSLEQDFVFDTRSMWLDSNQLRVNWLPLNHPVASLEPGPHSRLLERNVPHGNCAVHGTVSQRWNHVCAGWGKEPRVLQECAQFQQQSARNCSEDEQTVTFEFLHSPSSPWWVSLDLHCHERSEPGHIWSGDGWRNWPFFSPEWRFPMRSLGGSVSADQCPQQHVEDCVYCLAQKPRQFDWSPNGYSSWRRWYWAGVATLIHLSNASPIKPDWRF